MPVSLFINKCLNEYINGANRQVSHTRSIANDLLR